MKMEIQNSSKIVGRRMWEESKKMWGIAGPAIIMAVSQFSLEFVTSAFVGHLGTLELAAVSIVHNVMENFVYGIMLGMGSALETLCGQAVGAGQMNMLGIYLQKAWIITGFSALLLTPIYIFMSPILRLLHQDKLISDVAGKYALWSLKDFIKLSLVSAIMLCLELWYSAIIILMVGWLRNPHVAVDAFSICMYLDGWTYMIAVGFNAAVSVRLSNELGAGHPRVAKLSVIIATSTSAIIGTFLAVMILVFKSQYPQLFSDEPAVISEASKLCYFLAASMFCNSTQSVLQGVAVGAGWQSLVALINIGCYFFVGLLVGACYKFNLGIYGIWGGLLVGVVLQTMTLLIIVCRTDWHNEVSQARRIISVVAFGCVAYIWAYIYQNFHIFKL